MSDYKLISVLAGFVLFMFIMALNYYVVYRWHKCPYCGKRMKHDHTVNTGKGIIHKFHCPHCGAWDELPEDYFMNPYNE